LPLCKPVEQLSVGVAVMCAVSGTQLSAFRVVPVPVHAPAAQVLLPATVVDSHLPLAHWLSLVQRQPVLVAFAVPVVHDPRHDVTQPSLPPWPATPVHEPPEQPGLSLAHLPPLHWLSLLQTQYVLEAFDVPLEHK
jgi:hypothetical protein